MVNNPMVSIIIPVYNVERYLKACVDSACNQTYPHLQIILVDDGSTDSSGAICDHYAKEDSRVQVIHQQNQGSAIAKNVGLDAAIGDFLFFIDADDYVDIHAVELLLAYQKESRADILAFGMNMLYLSKIEEVPQKHMGEKMTQVEYLATFPSDWTCSLFGGKFFTKEAVGEVRFKNERRCIDDEFFTYKVVFNAKTVQIIAENLYYYRQRKGSVTKKQSFEHQKTQDSLDCMEERYQAIAEHYPQLKKGFLKHQFMMLVYIVYHFYIDKDLYKQIRSQLRRKWILALRFGFPKGELLAALKIMMLPLSYMLAKNDFGENVESDQADMFE